MSDRNLFSVWKVLFALVALLLLADCAHAYVGPGAGLELVGYAMSLLAWVGIAFSALLLYPFYALMRRLRGKKTDPASVPTESTSEHFPTSAAQPDPQALTCTTPAAAPEGIRESSDVHA